MARLITETNMRRVERRKVAAKRRADAAMAALRNAIREHCWGENVANNLTPTRFAQSQSNVSLRVRLPPNWPVNG